MNGNGKLPGIELESLVTWVLRGILALLMMIFAWNATQLIDKVESLEDDNAALRDRVTRMEERQIEHRRRINEGERERDDIETLLRVGRVRVLPPGEGNGS